LRAITDGPSYRPDPTVGEALARFYAVQRLCSDQTARKCRTCGFGPLELTFPNFEWRKQAIERHDIHHVLTGYACTLAGEIEMAAWEFGAGPFPDIRATLFCLPLLAAGAVSTPKKTFAAFQRGRWGRTLYGGDLAVLLHRPPGAVQTEIAPARERPLTVADALSFGRVMFAAFALAFSPLIAGLVFARIMGLP
jgi:hypothetical protein